MTGAGLDNLIATLGVAAPLVGILWLLLSQTNTERKDITTKFLQTLETTIKTNAEQSIATTSTISNLTTSINQLNAALTSEHQKMMVVLERMEKSLIEIERKHDAGKLPG